MGGLSLPNDVAQLPPIKAMCYSRCGKAIHCEICEMFKICNHEELISIIVLLACPKIKGYAEF